MQYSPVGGQRYAHTGLILVITVDHIAAITVLAADDSSNVWPRAPQRCNSYDDNHAFACGSSNLLKGNICNNVDYSLQIADYLEKNV